MKKEKEDITKDQFYYLGERAWNYQINKSYKLLQSFQLIAALSLAIALVSCWYAYSHIVKPKLIPYVVEVNYKTGEVNFKGMLGASKLSVNDAVMVKHLREFVSYLREVSADRVVLTKNLSDAYYFASPDVRTQITTYVQNLETSPFSLFSEETRRDLTFTNFQQTSESTWAVQWKETYRKDGVVVYEDSMSGSFTYKQVIPDNQSFAENNPFGIIFTYYSISKLRS